MDKVLPNEIIFNILFFLETDYIVTLANVNKRFHNIINSFIYKELITEDKEIDNKTNFMSIYNELKLSSNFFIYKTDHFIDEYKIKYKDIYFCSVMDTKCNNHFFVHYYSLGIGNNYYNNNDFYEDFLKVLKKQIHNSLCPDFQDTKSFIIS